MIGEFERRSSERFELRAAEGDAPMLAGYAAVFGRESELIGGSFREIIEPGAFGGAIAGDVLALAEHDTRYVLGRTVSGTLRLREDETGLAVEIDPPNTTWARDLMESMRRGDLFQMSFAFAVGADAWTKTADGTPLRSVQTVSRLYDVSAVSRPAYPQTTIQTMRSLEVALIDPKRAAERRRRTLDLQRLRLAPRGA